MTLTSLTLISAVGLLNLTLGFAAAALMGRGPWSARARKNSSAGGTHSSAATLAPTKIEEAVKQVQRDRSAATESIPCADVSNGVTDRTLQTMQHVVAGVERIEQGLQILLQQIQAAGESGSKEMLPHWVAAIISQANHLSEMQDELRHLAERENWSADIRHPTLESLANLQQNLQAAVVNLGQVRNRHTDRSQAVTGLIVACRETRGAINALSFFQMQA